MMVVYAREQHLAVQEYIDLLRRSGLAQRRPVDQVTRMEAGLLGSSVILTARVNGMLVGGLRAITDFHLHCYLADLAVDAAYQRKGIGLQLQRELQQLLAPGCKLKLSAAPDAAHYYSRIGYVKNDRAWELPPGGQLG